jgi:hypothetical protein
MTVKEHTFSGTVGLVTVWHSATDWGAKLFFALVVAVLAPRVGKLVDFLIGWTARRFGPKGK